MVNPAAGRGRAIQIYKKVEAALARLPIHFRIVITENISHAKETVCEAIKRNEYIAVIGGDGTARAIAGKISEQNGVLAIIPAGRGNDIARMLKLPLDPIEACQVLVDGKEMMMDMGTINQHPFLGICSLGLDSAAVQLANQSRLFKGRAAYLYGGLMALLNARPIQFNVNIDNTSFDYVGYIVAVANSQNYGGGMYLAPHALIQDGLFDVIFIKNISKYRLLINVPRLYKGTHIHEPGFEIIRGRHVKIESDPNLTILADGDSISSPPADISILPLALCVLVPSNK